MKQGLILAPALALCAGAAAADASFECSMNLGSQVEIGGCVSDVLATVDRTLAAALEMAKASAAELDGITGRAVAVPALEASQAAWEAYRDAQCEYVGSTFGGGSGTGIAITSCRVDLGRGRVDELMALVR
jgi:uncharacterized protein YecT (DUF1311 family)